MTGMLYGEGATEQANYATAKEYKGAELGRSQSLQETLRQRMLKSHHAQREIEVEREAAARAHRIAMDHPEFVEFVEALITLRIIRGGPFG